MKCPAPPRDRPWEGGAAAVRVRVRVRGHAHVRGVDADAVQVHTCRGLWRWGGHVSFKSPLHGAVSVWPKVSVLFSNYSS